MTNPKPDNRPLFPLLILITLLMISPDASAGNSEYVYELPMTFTEETSARALGMGGAYQAVSNDGGALRHNPAGLARIKRIEFSGSIVSLNHTNDVISTGIKHTDKTNRNQLSALAVAYPFPTYRGSMVVAAGYAVPWIQNRTSLRRVQLFDPPEDWDYEIFEDSSIGEWSGAFAVDIAPQISVGIRTTAVNGSYYTDRRWLSTGSAGPRLINDCKVNGFTGALGVLVKYNQIRYGATIELPRWIKWKSKQSFDGETEISLPAQNIDIPFSFTAGLATSWTNTLLTADVRFTDWTQLKYGNPPRPVRYDNGTRTEFAYRQTLNMHIGFEYLLDDYVGTGLRIRGGFAFEPVPYNIMVHTYDPYDSEGDIWSSADFSSEKISWSLGCGILIDDSMTIDLAYAVSSFTREIDVLTEEHSNKKLLLSMAFRAE